VRDSWTATTAEAAGDNSSPWPGGDDRNGLPPGRSSCAATTTNWSRVGAATGEKVIHGGQENFGEDNGRRRVTAETAPCGPREARLRRGWTDGLGTASRRDREAMRVVGRREKGPVRQAPWKIKDDPQRNRQHSARGAAGGQCCMFCLTPFLPHSARKKIHELWAGPDSRPVARAPRGRKEPRRRGPPGYPISPVDTHRRPPGSPRPSGVFSTNTVATPKTSVFRKLDPS